MFHSEYCGLKSKWSSQCLISLTAKLRLLKIITHHGKNIPDISNQATKTAEHFWNRWLLCSGLSVNWSISPLWEFGTKISGVLQYYSDEHCEKITDDLSVHKESWTGPHIEGISSKCYHSFCMQNKTVFHRLDKSIQKISFWNPCFSL